MGGVDSVEWVEPMLATAGALPDGPGWAYEVKFDGIRAAIATSGDGLRLRSRGGNDLTRSYPEFAALELPGGLLLDGEVVALDAQGRSDFELLQQRMQRSAPPAELQTAVPVSLVVFDVLRIDGELQTGLPYSERRDRLQGLNLAGGRVTVPPHFVDIAAAEVLAAVDAQGLEGVVAKRLGSRYEPGRRSRAWIKHAIRRHALVAVVGWTASRTRRDDLAAVALALPDEQGRLRFAGEVGTGFPAPARAVLMRELLAREQPDPPVAVPAGPARWGRVTPAHLRHWVRPGLVGEIAYRQLTTGEHRFRHPSWRRLRGELGLADIESPP